MLHPVATSAQLRAQDLHTIQVVGVPSAALMELAAAAVGRELLATWGEQARSRGVLVLAGRGNNGGDGYVLARHLHLAGVPVRVLATSGAHGADCEVARRACERLGVPVAEHGGLEPAGVVVDALFGTGLDREVRGVARARIVALNALRAEGRAGAVVSVDMPSGLDGDSGRVLGVAVRADLTVCFGRMRLGLLLEPGPELAGRVVVADIGLFREAPFAAVVPDGAWVERQLPARPATSHKGTFGHLGVVAGSAAMAGAAVLTCHAALRMGAGRVTLVTGPETVPRLTALPAEVMVHVDAAPTPSSLAGFDALVVGPGYGTDTTSLTTLRRLWDACPAPALFDADGLATLVERPRASPFPRALTPHPGEAGRILDRGVAAVQADRLGAARELSAWGAALLKGRHSLVVARAEEPPVFVLTGSPALATAGSGDVLSGMVGALMAMGLAAGPALVAGAFVHGLAGERLGRGPAMASDVVAAIPEAVATVGRRTDVMTVRPLLG